MDRKKKFSCLLVMMSAICMLLLHPITASAEEKLPGGVNNVVTIRSESYMNNFGFKNIQSYDFKVTGDYEAVGYLHEFTGYYSLGVVFSKNGSFDSIPAKKHFEDLIGTDTQYESNGSIRSSRVFSMNNLPSDISIYYSSITEDITVTSCYVYGLKIFRDWDAAKEYIESGSLDGLVKDEYASDWYLKGVDFKVYADDDPASEAGEDATYIQFNWLTDNLQEGDLLEIRTHNYLKKIGGDQISGMHNYITWANNVSAYDDVFTDKDGNERASYTMSQYDATKAWFSTLENKPLIFKSYDTDIYYLRPYRDGVYGRWCKVTLKRKTPTSSPDIVGREYGDIDEDGDWEKDEDLTKENADENFDENGNPIPESNPGFGDLLDGSADWSDIFRSFFDFMKNIPSLLGELPALVNTTIGFLPSWVIGFIGIGIIIVIILRIIGR